MAETDYFKKYKDLDEKFYPTFTVVGLGSSAVGFVSFFLDYVPGMVFCVTTIFVILPVCVKLKDIYQQRMLSKYLATANREEEREPLDPPVLPSPGMTAVFNSLDSGPIVAIEDAGYTNSEAELVCGEELDERFDGHPYKTERITGWVFYTEQDMDDANHDGILRLTYSASDSETLESKEPTLELGRKLTQSLREHNFEVNWDEDTSKKIEVNLLASSEVANEAATDKTVSAEDTP